VGKANIVLTSTSTSTSTWGYSLPRLQAPGEAEAELAELSKSGKIDAVLTDDVDALVFGATKILRK